MTDRDSRIANRQPLDASRGDQAPRSARHIRLRRFSLARFLLVASGIALLAVSAGCEGGGFSTKLDEGMQKIFKPRRTPQQYILIAVADGDPDIRRMSAAKVAESKKCNEEWAVKGFMAIAALETDPQTRCIAVRGLARSRDPRAVETFLKILNYQDYPPQEVRPPDDLTRWDVTQALADFSGDGLLGEWHEKTRTTLMERLNNEQNRHVRTAAARGLQFFPHPEVVDVLIAGLRDEDFPVVYQCEMSLAYLTGVTYDCDHYAWREWCAANQDDLFARGGTLPESRRPPYSGRWGKFNHDTKQSLQWMFPGKKGE